MFQGTKWYSVPRKLKYRGTVTNGTVTLEPNSGTVPQKPQCLGTRYKNIVPHAPSTEPGYMGTVPGYMGIDRVQYLMPGVHADLSNTRSINPSEEKEKAARCNKWCEDTPRRGLLTSLSYLLLRLSYNTISILLQYSLLLLLLYNYYSPTTPCRLSSLFCHITCSYSHMTI